jgi:hypothetical protein
MVIMFEACIWLAWWHERRAAKREREEQRQDQARRAALVGVASVEAAKPDGEHDALPEKSETSEESDQPKSEEHTDNSIVLPPESDHPHHPEPSPSFDDDYEQYLRDHAGHRPEVDTHTESVPVEERPGPVVGPSETNTSDESAGSTPPPEDGADPKTQNQT